MSNTIGIRREDLNKRGEQRVAIPPAFIPAFRDQGLEVLVQPGIHPRTQEVKRAFADTAYSSQGATPTEDLSAADFIFGLKEVKTAFLLPNKAYAFFSHTHKGQEKNRAMLTKMVNQGNTLIDYELITNEKGQRIITAFTYMAGYAGMIDSLWALGQRLKHLGTSSPWREISQSIDFEDLPTAKDNIRELGEKLSTYPLPTHPLICTFLGNGRTSQGAQEIWDLLPSEEIQLQDLKQVFETGDRSKVYKLVTDIPELFRLREGVPMKGDSLSRDEFISLYLSEPQYFESNLDQILPYSTLLMNCILWSPEYPRMLSRDQAYAWFTPDSPLKVIGDITCDPEGSIEFSQETWIDEPVFVYDPQHRVSTLGFEGPGIAVMAVTNLPCEFSADSSLRFGQDLEPYLLDWVKADFSAESPTAAGLPAPIQRAVILWKGRFMSNYAYMKEFTL